LRVVYFFKYYTFVNTLKLSFEIINKNYIHITYILDQDQEPSRPWHVPLSVG